MSLAYSVGFLEFIPYICCLCIYVAGGSDCIDVEGMLKPFRQVYQMGIQAGLCEHYTFSGFVDKTGILHFVLPYNVQGGY